MQSYTLDSRNLAENHQTLFQNNVQNLAQPNPTLLLIAALASMTTAALKGPSGPKCHEKARTGNGERWGLTRRKRFLDTARKLP